MILKPEGGGESLHICLPPLVEAVNTPDEALHGNPVLVQGQELTRGVEAQALRNKTTTRVPKIQKHRTSLVFFSLHKSKFDGKLGVRSI